MNIDYDQPIYFDSLMIPLHTLQHAEKSLIAQALQQLVIIDIFSLTKTHKTFIRINLSTYSDNILLPAILLCNEA